MFVAVRWTLQALPLIAPLFFLALCFLCISRGIPQQKQPRGVLFATDVAARGLDFPNIDWVVQMDCPEDVETYIHRVGRTARLRSEGKALLIMVPSEAPGMVEMLQEKKIPLTQTKVGHACHLPALFLCPLYALTLSFTSVYGAVRLIPTRL